LASHRHLAAPSQATQAGPRPPAAAPSRSNAHLQDRLRGALSGKEAPARRGSALPQADRLGAAFGLDLSAVPVYFGVGGALRGAQAAAVTDGKAIAFAEDRVDPAVAAEEVAHLAQAQGGGMGGAGIDSGGATTQRGPAEAEAKAAGREALEGGQPQVQEGLDASLHRAVENPRVHDDDPTDDWEKVHRQTVLADGYATDADGMPTDQASSTTAARSWEVSVVSTKDSPLLLSGSPREEDLFAVVAEGEDCTGVGDPVVAQHGDVVDPNIVVRAQEDALYINGGPSLDDIRQGGIGDCYFLAAVSEIVSGDPNRILSAVQPAGDNVNVNLFKYDGANWVAHSITTDRTLMHFLSKSDPTTTYDGLVGAGARVGDSPVGAEWYADVSDAGVLTITRRDVYEMALWAPILEKAYARFAEQTNQYGGGPARDTPNAGASGYEQINGGWEDQVYPIFYGDDMVTHRQEGMNYAPGQDLVPLNVDAITNLLRLNGAGQAGTSFMLSVDLDQDSAVDRLVQLIDFIRGSKDAARYPSLLRVMGQVRGLAATFQAAAGADRQAALERLAKGCARQAAPGAWPVLESLRSKKTYNDLFEHLNIVGHLGSDSSNGRRATYADHAYAVLSAAFVDQAGAAMALTPSNVAAQVANISGSGSTVTLRNPHHTNEPNLPTSGADADSEDGVFTMSLDQYLRSFALQEVARVKDTP